MDKDGKILLRSLFSIAFLISQAEEDKTEEIIVKEPNQPNQSTFMNLVALF